MTIEDLRKLHQATPFVPFTIYLADGRSFHVPGREFLFYSPNGQRTLIVHDDCGTFDILDLMLVTKLEASKLEGTMTIEQLRRLHQATPFQPFTIYLADGRSFFIPHREFLSHTPSGRTVVVTNPDETVDILDLLLVTDLKVHPPRQAQSEAS